jgi:uncharacterized RDD family membrane protein YckC
VTPAGLARRLAAMFYDALLVAALWFIAVLVLLPFTGGDAVPWPNFLRLWLLAVTFAFFGGFWTHGGQTLGMKTWRVRVERFDGGPLTWRDAALRYVAALVSLAPAGFGLWWMVFDRDRLALHDRLSRTRLVVIYSRRRLPARLHGI